MVEGRQWGLAKTKGAATMKTIVFEGKPYSVSIADKELKEVRGTGPDGKSTEVYYFDALNGALFPGPDGTIGGDERHAAILAAVHAELG